MESNALVQMAFMCRLTPVKSMVFRVIMLSISENARCFGGTYRLHASGSKPSRKPVKAVDNGDKMFLA
jgi:hypothetical protein